MATILTEDMSTARYISFNVGSDSFKLPCIDFTYEGGLRVGDIIQISVDTSIEPEEGYVFDSPVGLGSLNVITETINYSALEDGYGLTFANRQNYPKQSTITVMANNQPASGCNGNSPTTSNYSNGGLFAVRNTVDNKFIIFAVNGEIINADDTITQTLPYPKGTFHRKYRVNISVSQNNLNFYNWSTGHYEDYVEDTDPYVEGGGSSGGGGGEGNFDDTSDTISIPSLPSISGLNTGFFTAFVCTQSQLQSVSNYLWTNVISDILDTSTGLGEKVDALKKMVTSPYDAIMGCSLVPVSPPTGGSKDLKMYGVIDTGITLPYASSRWVEVDCGTLNIQEHWGSYLDYSPYTKTTSLYLPYIGVVSVDIDLIMAKALQVVYHVDILTGICIAYIVVDGSVKFQYQGHCSTTIPVTASDYSGAIQSGLGLVGNIANVVSSGVSGGLSGGLGGATLGAVGSAISQAPSVASNVMGMKPDIKSGGGVGSSGGILGVQKPFLIIERPKQSVPAFQNGFSGYPCNMTMKLSDLTGYTEVERINLTNISLTEDEKNELYEILESGVYL